tara:strand:+ start:240 stop:503 length:264 start_codon:yes stop_codon:yes gene_type:complete
MLREVKYFIYLIIIIIFIFFTGKYYFSDSYKKKSYESLNNIDKKISSYSEKLPILENDTKDIITYVKNAKTKKKKKFYFWELLDRND